jgi:hypothetical protein
MSKQMNDITRGLGLPHGVNDEFGAYWIGIMAHDYRIPVQQSFEFDRLLCFRGIDFTGLNGPKNSQ